MSLRPLLGLALAVLLSACAATPQSAALRQQIPAELRQPTRLADIPFFPQAPYQCGPAALATALGASHVDVTPEQLIPLVYVPARKGSFQVELMAAARSFGRLVYRISPELDDLLFEIHAGYPVLVLLNLGPSWYPKWHFAVVKGFDIDKRKILLNSGVYENYEMSLSTFERTWTRAENWAVLVLEPGEMPATVEPARFFNAVVDLEQNNAIPLVSKAYLSGLKLWPHNRNLRMGYGNLLYQKGALVAAADHFRLVIEHHPEYAAAYNNLAQILFELGEISQARNYARSAVELGGEYSSTYQETLQMVEGSAP